MTKKTKWKAVDPVKQLRKRIKELKEASLKEPDKKWVIHGFGGWRYDVAKGKVDYTPAPPCDWEIGTKDYDT